MNYIKYNGEKIPATFNYRTIKNIKDQYGIDLTSASDEMQSWISDISNQENLFFEMIQSGYKSEKKSNPYTLKDMVDILSEEHTYADFLNIYKVCGIQFITPSAKEPEATEKKKVLKMA